MGGLAVFENRFRYGILAVFFVLVAVLFVLKGNTPIDFTLSQPNDIDRLFPKSNQIVVLYSNEDETQATALAQQLEQDPGVRSITTYANSLGKEFTLQELSDAAPALIKSLGSMGESFEVPAFDPALIPPVLNLLYYEKAQADGSQAATAQTEDAESDVPQTASLQSDTPASRFKLGELFSFVQEQLAAEPFASLVDEETANAVNDFAPLITGVMNIGSYTQEELIDLVHSFRPDVDENLIRILCTYYLSQQAAGKEEANSQTMSIPELLRFATWLLTEDPRYASLATDEIRDGLASAKELLEGAAGQLRGEKHSLMVLDTILADEGEETIAFLDALEETCKSRFTGDYYFIGNTPMAWEMAKTFRGELNKITLITAIAIFLVVLVTFRSVLVPIVLVLLIQTSVYATMVIISLQGQGMYYLALLMVQSILMGATIDYAILYTNYYREKRQECTVPEALREAYQRSINTIMTSGMIIVLITAVLGYAFPNPTIGQICHTIAKGAAVALILIVFILPGVLAALDRFVVKKARGSKFS